MSNRTQGWATSDQDEIALRQKRGRSEAFKITRTQKGKDPYICYEVLGKQNRYLIEIRSLEERANSCDCPDWQVNGLGTCKHIEAILHHHRDALESTPNKKNEICLDPAQQTVRILWPRFSRKDSPVRLHLEPFFDEEGFLKADPLLALPALRREAEKLSPALQKKVRFSLHLEPWLETLRIRKEKQERKAAFLERLERGEETLDLLQFPLHPYQREGVLHLALTERALLADEMGLGKTIQAIGACRLLQKRMGAEKFLIITPASLKHQWAEQIRTFTGLSSIIIQGGQPRRRADYLKPAHFYLCNYEQIHHDLEWINTRLQPDGVILDEAQRIKNWKTRTAQSIKGLQNRYAFVLTGTPLENRIDEIYSIIQFLDPTVFGPLFQFNREFHRLDEKGNAVGFKNIKELHRRIAPLMLRRRKSDVEEELPPRTIEHYCVELTEEQRGRYGEYEEIVSRLATIANRRPLKEEEMKRLQRSLSCMRMICDSSYILDQSVTVSPKLDELMPILEELLENPRRKVLIFSEWERMLTLLSFRLEEMGVEFAWHTGTLTQEQRRSEVERFKSEEAVRLLLLTDSGGVGLNLQVADTVINLDMPWNPARLEQRIARAWRKHQKNAVQVINLTAADSIESRILHVIEHKRSLAQNVLDLPDTDEMALPSTRNALIETIQEILQGTKSTDTQTSRPLDTERFVQESVARHGARIERIMGSGQNLLVVLDAGEGALKEELAQEGVEVLTQEEYALIERLMRQGLIAKTDRLQTHYAKTAPTPPQNPECLEKAQKIYAAAKRSFEMAQLLENGGFAEESLTPYCESLRQTLRALATLQGDPDLEDAQVVEIFGLSSELPGMLKQCAQGTEVTIPSLVNIAQELQVSTMQLLETHKES